MRTKYKHYNNNVRNGQYYYTLGYLDTSTSTWDIVDTLSLGVLGVSETVVENGRLM